MYAMQHDDKKEVQYLAILCCILSSIIDARIAGLPSYTHTLKGAERYHLGRLLHTIRKQYVANVTMMPYATNIEVSWSN